MKKLLLDSKGIALTTLIIIIIILVVIAAVSVCVILNMGIARNDVNEAQQYAEEVVKENSKETGVNNNTPSTSKEQKGPTGKPLVNKTTVANYVENVNLVGEDEFGNPITIPVGFKVAADSGNNVTEGIVIEDNDVQTDGNGNQRGNQYVWVPVGTIHTDKAMTKANDKTIIAGRYEFADGSDAYKDKNNNTLKIGTPILKQSLENYSIQPSNIVYSTERNDYNKILSATNSEIVIDGWYYEDTTARKGVAASNTSGLNRTAKNLSDFAKSVSTNHGYYMARYEASWGTGDKVKSRVLVGKPLTSEGTRTNGQLWNFVTEIKAAEYCQNLYNSINSDLMNSYAWDTALVFIQTFDNRANVKVPYSYQKTEPVGAKIDEVCKINDMASNTIEWTTEFSTFRLYGIAGVCVVRGGERYRQWALPI